MAFTLKGGAGFSSEVKHLCLSGSKGPCVNYTQTTFADGRVMRACCAYYDPLAIPAPVISCSKYAGKNELTLRQMYKMATLLDLNRREAGFEKKKAARLSDSQDDDTWEEISDASNPLQRGE